jgi:hypothetical protein
MNCLVSTTKTLPGCPHEIQRKILPTSDAGCLMRCIIHFEILNFCTSSILETSLLPKVFTVEILQPKPQCEVANVL